MAILNSKDFRDKMLSGTAPQSQQLGMMTDNDARRVAQSTQPQSGLLSSIGRGASGLLGALGSGGSALGSVLGSGGSAFAQSLSASAPQMKKDILDAQRFYQMERMKSSGPVLASQLGQLKRVTPAGVVAGLPQYRAAEQSAIQQPELDRLKAEADKLRAAGSQSAQKTSPKTYLTLDESGNKKIIETYFDKISGERKVSGTNEAVPEGSLEINQVDSPNLAFLNALEKTVYEDRDRLIALDSYLSDVAGSSQGINNLIDRASLKIKTLINEKEITEKELKTAKGQAKLQGLLGRFRIPIVGGGVMTEQDALRILSALGGEFDAFQNKQVTKEIIEGIRKETASRFERESEKFNRTLGGIPDVSYAKGIYRRFDPYTNPFMVSTGEKDNSPDKGTGSGVKLITTEMINAANVKNGSE